MTDQKHVAARLVMAFSLRMHFGDKRASGVQIEKLASLCFSRHGFGHAMGGEDYTRVIRHLVEFVNKDGAHALQPFDDVTVMDDFVADIDGGAILSQRQFDDANRTLDACTKAARGGKQQLELRPLGPRPDLLRASHEEPAWLQSRRFPALAQKSAAGY